MTTLAQLKAWLKQPTHIRRLLVEIDNVTDLSGSNTATIYLSNGAYSTTNSDTPANKMYLPVLSGGVSFTQNLSMDGALNISYGDLELNNSNGALDDYLNKIFIKKPITIYLGDPSWPKSDFKIIFKGSIISLTARSREVLNIVISDKLYNLNTSLSEATVAQPFKNNTSELKPVCFGECFNVTPLINQTAEPNTYYIVHDRAIEDIIEVRDMGAPITNKIINSVSVAASNIFTSTQHGLKDNVPVSFTNISGVVGISTNTTYYVISTATNTFKVSTTVGGTEVDITTGGTVTVNADIAYTKDLTNGRFKLNQATFGQITCSVQGDKSGGSYTNKVGDIIKNILINYGPSNTRLTNSDIDTSNFTSFNSTYTSPVGYYAPNKENILEVCNKIASSIRAKVTVNMGPMETDSDVGKVKLVVLNEATSSTVVITPADIEERSLTISETPTVRAATKINYCKNWTVQTSGLAGGLPAASVALFNTEWLSTSTIDNTVKANYSLSDSPEPEDTYLITKAGADSESVTRNSLWSKKRIVYTMTGYPHLFDIKLGDFVKLTNNRFGLSESLGTVVNVSIDWISGRIEIGVLV